MKIAHLKKTLVILLHSCWGEEQDLLDLGVIIRPNDASYYKLRPAFSKLYDNWPYILVEALPPREDKLSHELTYTPATQKEMIKGEKAVEETVKYCIKNNIKFTARSGGHNNAGASVMNGLLTLDVRGLNIIEPKFNSQNAIDSQVRRSSEQFWSPGTVRIGAGATAGQAGYVTYNITSSELGKNPSLSDFAGSLPIGQKPSIGMSGITLGGGFGFFTRYAGLLCDRLVSFKAINPQDGNSIKVKKNGKHKDLFWAACGGGGGNFAVVTEMKYSMMPVCPYYPDFSTTTYGECNGVTKLEYYVPINRDLLDFYQDWSFKMDTRITPNFEVVNKTHGMVAGIFMGPKPLFQEALKRSGISSTTKLTLQGFMKSSKEESFAQAITDLSGWTNNNTAPDHLVRDFLGERSFFKYKSYWLKKKLSRDGIDILMNANIHGKGNNSLVFEFQAMGGGPENDAYIRTDGGNDEGIICKKLKEKTKCQKQDGCLWNKKKNICQEDFHSSAPSYFSPDSPTLASSFAYASPPNNFSSVDADATAFAHRDARHCLMLKATGDTLEEASVYLKKMELIYASLEKYVVDNKKKEKPSAYYNHMDLSLPPGDDFYFRNGVPGNNKNFWVNKLAKVRKRYNKKNRLSNLRPCCEKQKGKKEVI